MIEQKRDISSEEHRLDSTQDVISTKPSPHEKKAQATVGSIEIQLSGWVKPRSSPEVARG